MNQPDSVEQKLAALNALGEDLQSPDAVKLLRKLLADRSNRMVARAAELIAEKECSGFADDLLKAYRHLLISPLKSDPGCLGKTAILRALVRIEHKDPELYRGAIEYEQLEPVWGGAIDAAAELRGTAAAGLVNCVTSVEVLNRCALLLVDQWHDARCGAAHAIGILRQLEGVPLLRLKLLTGDARPEVIGSCCTALLRLDREEGVAFVSRFLSSSDPDVCIQAALALAESRRPNIFEPLCAAWERQADSAARESLLVCIGLLRTSEAHEFLLSLIDRQDLRAAADAVRVLKTHGNVGDMKDRVAAAVEATSDAHLKKIFQMAWRDNA